MEYRKLRRGERIKLGDEFMSMYGKWELFKKDDQTIRDKDRYGEGIRPVRRKLKGSAKR